MLEGNSDCEEEETILNVKKVKVEIETDTPNKVKKDSNSANKHKKSFINLNQTNFHNS